MFTPQEIYVIQFSEISQSHLAENHYCSEDTILRYLRQLIDRHCYNSSANDLNSKSSKKSLEMFVFFKKPIQSSATKYNQEVEDFSSIVKNCKRKCFINFENENMLENLNCCSELKVYEDIKRLDISDNANMISYNSKDVEKSDGILSWYKTDVSIKRYDCKPINGKQVWEYIS